MRLELVNTMPESAVVPTQYGDAQMSVFRCEKGVEHVCVVLGEVKGATNVLCRIHSACATGELFGSLKCDCGQQLERALQQMQHAGQGVLIYMNQEGRGIGLANKLRAYALQAQGADTVDANRMLGLPDDVRTYGSAVEQLKRLGLRSVRLMSNNPLKLDAVRSGGLACERESHLVDVGPAATAYLESKQSRMGHLREHDDYSGLMVG